MHKFFLSLSSILKIIILNSMSIKLWSHCMAAGMLDGMLKLITISTALGFFLNCTIPSGGWTYYPISVRVGNVRAKVFFPNQQCPHYRQSSHFFPHYFTLSGFLKVYLYSTFFPLGTFSFLLFFFSLIYEKLFSHFFLLFFSFFFFSNDQYLTVGRVESY